MSSLFAPNKASVPSSYLDIMEVSETITVPAVSIDQYCSSNSIERINLMKIDVQGGELRVLKGSAGMLGAQSIDIVLAEAFMLAFYDEAPLFDELITFMASFGYRVRGLYEPTISGRSGRIQWADFVFVSPQMEAVSKEMKRRSLSGRS